MQSLPQLFFCFFVQRPICSNLFQEVVQFFLHAINANPAVYPLDSNAFYKEIHTCCEKVNVIHLFLDSLKNTLI